MSGKEETDYPGFIRQGDKRWSRTGKLGTHIKTGKPSAEYSHHTPGREERGWAVHGVGFEPEDGPMLAFHAPSKD